MPCLTNKGNVTNKDRDGSTSQKILVDKALTFDISFVSI